MNPLPSRCDEIREAQKLIYELMQPTPQISWPLLNQYVGGAGVGQARKSHAHWRIQSSNSDCVCG